MVAHPADALIADAAPEDADRIEPRCGAYGVG